MGIIWGKREARKRSSGSGRTIASSFRSALLQQIPQVVRKGMQDTSYRGVGGVTPDVIPLFPPFVKGDEKGE